MKTLIRPLVLLCLPVVPASLADAALTPSNVSSDARWVLSIDLNVVRETSIGKQLVSAITAAGPSLGDSGIKLDAAKVFATIGNITAYGTNFSQNPKDLDGALVIQGTEDLRKIADGLIAQTLVAQPEKVTEIKDLPFEAYSISGDVIVGLPKEPLILLSKSRGSLVRAYDVVRGKAPSLANSSSDLKKILPRDSGAYVTAASVVTPAGMAGNHSPQARILQMTSAGSIAIGEDNTQTYAHLQLVASSEEMADKLIKIVQGMTAMLSLAETSDKQLEEFVKSVSVERHGNAVNLRLAYSSARLAEMISNIQNGGHRGSSGPSRPSHPSRPAVEEKSIQKWSADQQLGSGTAGADQLVTRTIEDVKLQNGTTVSVGAQRNGGDSARLDYLEIIGQQPNAQPLRFEAEFMKLNNYRPEVASYASGGKVIALHSAGGSARLQFPGAAGSYTIKVRYVDDPAGSAVFTLKTQDPEPVEHE